MALGNLVLKKKKKERQIFPFMINSETDTCKEGIAKTISEVKLSGKERIVSLE